VTPVLHTPAAPQVPGCERGHAPKQYPAGRVCVTCPTVLRRTNPGPWCDPCLNKDAKARARATAYAAPAPATTAAPAARTTKEEKVAKESMREAVLLAFARDPSRCFNAGDVVKLSGISPSCVYKNLKALVASGDLVKRAPGVYCWPKIEDAKPASAHKLSRIRLEQLMISALESAPGAYFSARSLAREFGVEIEDIDATVARLEINGEHVVRRVTAETIIDGGEYGMLLEPNLAPATPPAPAPSTSGEQPANEAPASEVLPPQARLAPFAGIMSTTFIGYSMSCELRILDDLEQLDDEAYERVMQYTLSKRLLK